MRLLLCLVLLVGCVPEDVVDPIPLAVPAGCEWLSSLHCGLPWPSDRWLVEDPSTDTGLRLEYEADALPHNMQGEPIDPEPYRAFDGFSPAAQILTVFPRPIDVTGMAWVDEFEESLAADSPSILVNLDTGERIPHFVETDVRWHDSTHPDRTDVPVLLYIRPAVRLDEDAWYGVALRDLVMEEGVPVEASAPFAALRDAVITTSPAVEAARPRFEAMFGALEDAGVPREDLVQAWSWHTASGEAIRGDLLAMRDDALLRLDDDTMECTVDEVQEAPNARVARRIQGHFKVPLYMSEDAPGSDLVRDADGIPAFQGWADVPFTVAIPASLGAGDRQGRLVQFGHGLMGTGSDEIDSGFNRTFGQDYEAVFVATDWQGMSRPDLITVASALSGLAGFTEVADRLMQGMIGQVALTRSFLGPCRDLPELEIGGQSVLNDDPPTFIGISQGGILGGTFLTISPDITRGALLVGSTNVPYTMTRSLNWREYELITKTWYGNRIDRELGVALIGSLWDRSEPNAWLPHLLSGELAGTGPKQVLYQVARHDLQVQNLMSEVAGRDLGIPLLTPSSKSVWGLEEAAAPLPSALVYYDLQEAAPPVTNELPEAINNVHNNQRLGFAAMEQIDRFLRPGGQVEGTCEGGCDPD